MDDWQHRIVLGIKPEKEARTCDDMRRAISIAARDSHLIRTCRDMAEVNGMSGEDAYVLLAYNALIELERQWTQNMRHISLSPSPMIVTPPQNGEGHS